MKPLTPQQRLDLINRVCQKAYDETESWRSEDLVGVELAFLCWAIASDLESASNSVDWIDNPPILKLFKEWFPRPDPVWQFIQSLTDKTADNLKKAAEIFPGASWEYPGFICVTSGGVEFAIGDAGGPITCDWSNDPASGQREGFDETIPANSSVYEILKFIERAIAKHGATQ